MYFSCIRLVRAPSLSVYSPEGSACTAITGKRLRQLYGSVAQPQSVSICVCETCVMPSVCVWTSVSVCAGFVCVSMCLSLEWMQEIWAGVYNVCAKCSEQVCSRSKKLSSRFVCVCVCVCVCVQRPLNQPGPKSDMRLELCSESTYQVTHRHKDSHPITLPLTHTHTATHTYASCSRATRCWGLANWTELIDWLVIWDGKCLEIYSHWPQGDGAVCVAGRQICGILDIDSETEMSWVCVCVCVCACLSSSRLISTLVYLWVRKTEESWCLCASRNSSTDNRHPCQLHRVLCMYH